MEGLFFNLQRFQNTNMDSGTASEPHEYNSSNGDDLSVANYVVFNGRDSWNNKLVTAGSNYVTVNGQTGKDSLVAYNSKHVIINGNAGADTIDVYNSENIEIDAGADGDVISVHNDVENVKITAGAGNDTVSVINSTDVTVDVSVGTNEVTISDATNVSVKSGGTNTFKLAVDSTEGLSISGLTDSDTLVLTDLASMPRFATFSDGVLNLDGVLIHMSDKSSAKKEDIQSALGKMKVQFGTAESSKDNTTTLADLLAEAPPTWTAVKNKNVATYKDANGNVIATLTGLKKFTTAYTKAVDIPGIAVDNHNNIILSADILGTSNVVLAGNDYNLTLDSDVRTSVVDEQGWAVSGGKTAVKSATFKTKSSNNGYYVGDDGKKVKYLKANTVTTVATVGNLVKGTNIVTASAGNSIADLGITAEFDGNFGTVTIADSSQFDNQKVTVDGEDVTYNITAKDFNSIVGGKNDDHIIYGGTGTTISTAAGNDWVTDNGSKNKLDVGAGNDYISGAYSSDTVIAGAGNDYVGFAGSGNDITMGAGNDTAVIGTGAENKINAKAGGANFITTAAAAKIVDTEIIGGTGNDTVKLAGTSFDGGSINVGDGANLVEVNVASDTAIVSGKGIDTLNLNGLSYGEVDAGAGNDVVKLSGASYTVLNGGAGNDAITIEGGDNNTIDMGAGNDTALISDSVVTSSILKMGDGNDNVSVIGGTVNEAEYADGVEGNVINTGAGNDFVLLSDTGVTSTINAGFGNDTVSIVKGDNYAGNVFHYNYGNGNVTVKGFTAEDVLQIAASEGNYTIDFSNVAQAGIKVSVGEGKTAGSVTLLLDDKTESDTIVAKLSNNITLEDNVKQITWTFKNGTATGKVNNVVVATITGLKKAYKDADNKSLTAAQINTLVNEAIVDDGDVIKVGAAVLDSDSKAKLTVSNGYKLALGDDVTKSTTNELSWTISDAEDGTKTAVCDPAVVNEGYLISDDKKEISYTEKTTNQDPPTIKGLSSDLDADTAKAGITLDGTKVILSADVLGNSSTDTNITVESNGTAYSLELGDDVEKSKAVSEGWFLDTDETDTSITATYKTGKIDKGYFVDSDGAVKYREAVDQKVYAEVYGLKPKSTASDITFNSDTKLITVGKNALVTVNKTTPEGSSVYLDTDEEHADYSLAIGKGAVAAKITDAGFTVAGTTATYKTRAINKTGYGVSEDGKAIDYYDETDGGDTLVTIKGLKARANAKFLSMSYDAESDTNVITLTKDVLGTTSVTLSIEDPNYDLTGEGYKYAFALDSEVAQPSEVNNTWDYGNGSTVKYMSKSDTAGFTIEDVSSQTVVYHSAKAATALTTITGLKGATATDVKFADLDSQTIVISAAKIAVAKNGANVSGSSYEYTLDKAGKLTNIGAGTTFKGSAEGDTLYGGTGNDMLYGNDGVDSLFGGNGNDYLSGDAGDDYLNGGAGNDKLDGGDGADKLYGGNGNDELTDGAGDDSLFGGNGNDVLHSTSGKNELTGGAGRDIFLYSGGTAVIKDYAAGADKIKISASTEGDVKGRVEGKNVIFKIGDNDAITVVNGRNKNITLVKGEEESEITEKYVAQSADVAEVWFDDDNEFATAASISDITKTEVVADVETYKADKLTQENLVTFAK